MQSQWNILHSTKQFDSSNNPASTYFKFVHSKKEAILVAVLNNYDKLFKHMKSCATIYVSYGCYANVQSNYQQHEIYSKNV